MYKKLQLALCALGLMLFAAQVSAEDWYGGIAFGNTSVDYDDEAAELQQQVSVLNIPGLSSASASIDDEDTGIKLYLGNNINDYMAVEFGYTDLGEVSTEASVTVFGAGSASISATESVYGLFGSLVGKLPVSETVNITGRAGIYLWDYDLDITESGTLGSSEQSFTDDGNDVFYGLGLEVGWFNLFYEVYDVDGEDIDFIGIGANFSY